MNGKKFGLMIAVLGLFLAFSLVPAEAAPGPKENTAKKCSDGDDNDRDGLTDGEDPDCQALTGGSEGEPITPAIIKFRDGGGDGLKSDTDMSGTDTYRHRLAPDGTADHRLEVFVGSAANEGNIFLKGQGDGILNVFHDGSRRVHLVLTCDSSCSNDPDLLPSAANNLFAAALRVNVKKVISGGVLAMTPDMTPPQTVFAPMTLRIDDNSDPSDGFWDLKFDSSEKKCPGGDNVSVSAGGSGHWTVKGVNADGDLATGCLAPGGGDVRGNPEPLGLYTARFLFDIWECPSTGCGPPAP